jgi:hypothetical protein
MSIFLEMGPYYIWLTYQMDESSFWKLHTLLQPHLEEQRKRKLTLTTKRNTKTELKMVLFPTSSRLSVALRYFAGGSPYDISQWFMAYPTLMFSPVYGELLMPLTAALN